MTTALAQGILDRHKLYGWSDPAGEWGEIQRDVRAGFKDILDAGDTHKLDRCLAGFFRTPLYFGLVSITEAVDKLGEQVLWRVALWSYLTDGDIDKIKAPDVGDPFVVNISDTKVMVDAPRFDVYANHIAKALPDGGLVVELGGGYGGLALQLKRRAPNTRVVLVDIPETLYLAWYWLTLTGECSVSWIDERVDADVTLVPVDMFGDLTLEPDLVFAGHMLSGLDADTIAEYMTWLSVSGARYFYHDDAVERADAGVWLADRYDEVLVEKFNVPDCYTEVWRDRIPWTGITDRFCQVFWERAA